MIRGALAAALLILCATQASAQEKAALDRRVTLHVLDLPLPSALDRAAEASGVRISYSPDLLPAGARVTMARDTTTLGALLRDMLRDVPVRVVPVDARHVVLAPAPVRRVAAPPVRPTMLRNVTVRRDAAAEFERHRTSAGQNIRFDGREQERSLTHLLDRAAPGMWLWEPGPAALIANYASVRGATSFGVSRPKVYMDGVELANPLLLTQLEPDLVDHVTVTSGPQGTARYGADAMSGVIELVSRHGPPPDGERGTMRSEMGWAHSAFGPTSPLQQHSVALHLGDNFRSAGLAVSGAASGNYVPNAYTRDIQALATARVIGATSSISGTARMQHTVAGVPTNPLLGTSVTEAVVSGPQELNTYGLGTTVVRTPSEDLTYTFTAGVDGYRLNDVPLARGLSPVDSALRSAVGGADRITLRATSVRRRELTPRLRGSLTVAAEQSVLRDNSMSGEPLADSISQVTDWSSNAGLLLQTDVSLDHAVFLTAGSRLERAAAPRRDPVVALLPTLGVAFVKDFSFMTARLRGAYGRGFRSPEAGGRLSPYGLWTQLGDNLQALESQSGTEAGLDLLFGAFGAVHLTRFYQEASTRAGNALLGTIVNRGWEATASVAARGLSVSATGAITDSRVRRVGDAYTGDLRAGDRMLGVPGFTGALTAGWRARRWSTEWSVRRASNWVNYDRLRLATAMNGLPEGASNSIASDDGLRGFWQTYPGITRLNGSFSVRLPRGMGMFVNGENLTNRQLGEPDSVTVLPGRAITLGLSAKF